MVQLVEAERDYPLKKFEKQLSNKLQMKPEECKVLLKSRSYGEPLPDVVKTALTKFFKMP